MDGRAGIFWDREGPIPPEILDELQFVDQEEVELHRQYAARPEGHRPRPRNIQYWRQNNQFGDDFILWEPEQCVLAPLSVSLRAQIVQDTAQVTVTQLFWNNSEHAVPKGSYSMPLPAGCTVTDFICRIGSDKVVKAKVKPKEEARDTFDRAVRNDRTAALLEQTTPEVFSTSLGNIPKRTKIRVEISFITLLKYEFVDRKGCTTLTIPASLASSYGNPQPHLRAALPAPISQRLSIDVEISAAERVLQISSKSHRIVVERRQGTFDVDNWEDFATAQGENEVHVAFVRLEDGSTFLDKDFVVEMFTAPQDDEEQPQAWLESHPTVQNHKAVMLTIPPKFFLKNRPVDAAGEIVFVADRSYSMTDKVASLKSAMQYFLVSIPQGRHFNLWSFGTGYSSRWPESRPNSNQETLEMALRHVKEDFAANMGGTELLPALKAIVNARDGRRTTDIIVLTDGYVSHMEQTIEYVQHMKLTTEGAVRVFALGIGLHVSHELVEGIAKAGGGYAEVIPSASHGGWESRVVAVLEAAVHGHLAPLRVQAEGITEGPISADRDVEAPHLAQQPRILKSPADLSTLSPFLRQRAYMLFDAHSDSPPLNNINIISTSEDGQESTTRVPVKQAPAGSVSIHKLGARAVLGDLEKGQSWIHSSPDRVNRSSREEEELVRSEGEILGCKWSLVSKWTSFYAIDEPYRPDEHDQEPFMDVVHVQVPFFEEAMDLLRPRGLPNRPNGNAGRVLPETVHEIHVDSDEDDETSDSEDFELGSHDASDSDSDDEGGGGGNLQGDGADNNDSAGGGQPPSPERDDPNAGGNDSNTENPGSGNGPTTTAASGAYSMAANTITSPPNDHADPTSGVIEDRRKSQESLRLSKSTTSSMDWPYLHDLEVAGIDTNANPSPDAAAHKIAYGAKETPKCGDSFSRRIPRSADRPPKNNSRLSSLATSESYLPTIGTGSKYSKNSNKTSLYEKPTLSRGSPDWDMSTYGNRSVIDDDSSSDTGRPSKPNSESLSEALSLGAADLDTLTGRGSISASSLPHKMHRGETLSAASKYSPYPSAKSARSELDPVIVVERDSLRKSSDESYAAISAPQHNLTAATSLLPQQISAPITPEQKHGEQIVQKLVQYQRYNGSFRFGSDVVLAKILGYTFLPTVPTIKQSIPASIILKEAVATTVAIVVLFEEKFQFCKELWTMIHTKAQKWLDEKFGSAHNVVKDSLYAIARSCIQRFELPGPGPALPPAPGHPTPYTNLGYPATSPTTDPTRRKPITDSASYAQTAQYSRSSRPLQAYPFVQAQMSMPSQRSGFAPPYFSGDVGQSALSWTAYCSTQSDYPAPAQPSAPQLPDPYRNMVHPMFNQSVYHPTQQIPVPAQPQNPYSLFGGQTPQPSPWAARSPTESPTQQPNFASAIAPAPAPAMYANAPETSAVPSKRYANPGVSLDAADGKEFHGWLQGGNTMPLGVSPETCSFGAPLAREEGTGGARVALDSAPGEDDLF